MPYFLTYEVLIPTHSVYGANGEKGESQCQHECSIF